MQGHGDERGRLRIGRDVGLVAIGWNALAVDDPIAVLAANGLIENPLGTQRLNRAQHFGLLIVNCIGIEIGGRLHGGKRDQLKDVVRNHVAEGAGRLVIAAAQFDSQLFGDGDLHVIDVAPIPDRLEDAVGEAKRENILHRFLAEIMVDAIDLLFIDNLADGVVQSDRRRQVVPKRLFDHHAPPLVAFLLGEAGGAKLLDYHREELGAGGKIEENIALSSLLLVRQL